MPDVTNVAPGDRLVQERVDVVVVGEKAFALREVCAVEGGASGQNSEYTVNHFVDTQVPKV
jgi:hypothetical protein